MAQRKLFCQCGPVCYRISLGKERLLRAARDLAGRQRFAAVRQAEPLPALVKGHCSVIRRRLPGVDPALQEGKARNLALAAAKVNGLIVAPGETFSFWRTVGSATRRKGYQEGLTISGGRLGRGVGGGLCQLANLIHWLVLNSPLTVTELHHHSDALFPDERRTVPFGTGTSVFYNNVDYRFRNDTDQPVQLLVWLREDELCGELRSLRPFPCRYRLTEENSHYVRLDDGWYRLSRVYKLTIDRASGRTLRRELILDNHSRVLFDPALIPPEELRKEDGGQWSPRPAKGECPVTEPISLNHLVEHCAQSPHLPAYESGGRGLSYGQLLTRARVLAAALEQLWPGDGPILLYGHKESALPVGMLACLLAGRAYVPCDDGWPAARVEAVFRQSGAAALLFAREAPAPWPEELAAAPLWPMSEPGITEPLAAPRRCDPEQTAYILFSSGSTGQPKGIPVPRRALANFARWITARPGLALSPGETVVGQAGFSFDLSLAELTLALCGPGRLVSLARQELADPALLFQRLAASGAAVLVCTPTFLELCLCDKAFSPALLPKLRAVFCCGEVLPRPAAEKFVARFPGVTLLNAYGPTEAACAVCAVDAAAALAAFSEGPLPVGLAAEAAVEIAALSPDGEPLAEGEAGELALRGESVFSGYLPGCGDARFSGGWYRTGDSGFVKDGHVWCTGRLDDQLKYCGWRIEPGEVEAALRTLPGVERAAVLPQRTPDGRVRRLCAFLQAEQSARLSDEAVRGLLALHLPAYMLPGRFFWLDVLPVTENGKCDRAQLARDFLG